MIKKIHLININAVFAKCLHMIRWYVQNVKWLYLAKNVTKNGNGKKEMINVPYAIINLLNLNLFQNLQFNLEKD